MGCGQKWHSETREQGKVQPVEMSVDNVEFCAPARDGLEQSGNGGDWIGAGPPESKRSRPHRNELCPSLGVAACKERHLVTERNKLLDQPGDHPFGAAVESRWNAFG